MILSHHTTKNSQVVAGSKVLTDSARLVWLINKAKDDADTRVMTTWKSNRPTAGTMRYQITGEGNDVRAVFTGPDTGPESQAPSSRSARLRLASVTPVEKARAWLAAHPENEETPAAPEAEAPEAPYVPDPANPPVQGQPLPPSLKSAPDGREDPVAYLKRYIDKGDPEQVRKIAASLLTMKEATS
jgi:hypothetical protein